MKYEPDIIKQIIKKVMKLVDEYMEQIRCIIKSKDIGWEGDAESYKKKIGKMMDELKIKTQKVGKEFHIKMVNRWVDEVEKRTRDYMDKK